MIWVDVQCSRDRRHRELDMADMHLSSPSEALIGNGKQIGPNPNEARCNRSSIQDQRLRYKTELRAPLFAQNPSLLPISWPDH